MRWIVVVAAMVMLSLPEIAGAQAPSCSSQLVGPCNPWPWTATIGGNVIPDPGFEQGNSAGNCTFLGPWLTTGGTWSLTTSPVHSGNCAAKINNAGSGSNVVYQIIKNLPVGWYKLEGYVASVGNDLSLLSVQYAAGGATDANVMVRTSFTANGTLYATSLQTTVCTAAGCNPDQCFNLLNGNFDHCANATAYVTIQQLVNAINAVSGYTATVLNSKGAYGSVILNQQTVDIFGGAANLLGFNPYAGSRWQVVAGNFVCAGTGILGDSASYTYTHALICHNAKVENVTVQGVIVGSPTGQQYFDDVALTQLQAPPVDLVLRYPNDRFTEWQGLDLSVDYTGVSGACSGVSGCGPTECGIQLKKGASVISTACVDIPPPIDSSTGSTWFVGATIPFAAQSNANNYSISMIGNAYVPQINLRKVSSVPAAWNNYIDTSGWFHYAGDSTPHVQVGVYDTSNFGTTSTYWQCHLNGVSGTPLAITSIGESGTTVTVDTATAHGLAPGAGFAAAQFLTPLAASGFSGNWTVAHVNSATEFTFNAPSGLPTSDSNDGVIGGVCNSSNPPLGFIGTLARLDGLQDYTNYYIADAPTATAIIPLGNVLSALKMINNTDISIFFSPWNAVNPVLNGAVCSADSVNTGCYCTNGGIPGSNANWGPNGTHLCGPSPGPGYSGTILCAATCPDDLNYHFTTLDSQLGQDKTYLYDEPPNEYFLSILPLETYSRLYTEDFSLDGVLNGAGTPDPWRYFVFRDTDLPGADNYNGYANIALGGTSPTYQPTLTPTIALPGFQGMQQTIQSMLISLNGEPYTNPPVAGARPVKGVVQQFGYTTGLRWLTKNQLRASVNQCITAGCQSIDFWSMGLEGIYSLTTCPDFPSNQKACQAEFLNTTHQVLSELRQNERIYTGPRVQIPFQLAAGVTGFAAQATSCGALRTFVVEENNNATSVTDAEGHVLGPVGSGTDFGIFQQ